jgi:hypothetical protein
MKDSQVPRWLDGARQPDKQALRQALDEAPRFVTSDVRRRRVWARVEDPRRARAHLAPRRAFAMGALVASGFAVVALVAFDRLRPHFDRAASKERNSNVQPRVTVAKAHPNRVPVATPPAAALPARTQIRTQIRTKNGERLTRRLAQGAQAVLQPNSRLAIGGDLDAAPEIRAGRITFKVAHQPIGQHFEVRAGAFKVIVVGTRFVVGVDGPNVSVSVLEGVVEIWGTDRIARLGKGQRWSSGTIRDADAPARVAMAPPAAPGSGRQQAKLAPDLEPLPPERDGELAAARAARAAADPKRALAIYQRLTDRGGAVAENALYEIGAIYRDQLHEPRQALAAWERYRSRYPAGLLRAEADLSIVDTLSGLGESTRALKEALGFLQRYPLSERRGEITRVAGDLYRSRGNCQEAVKLYLRVDATRASATDADDAAFGRAACLVTAHDPDADATLRAYLRDRPGGRHRTDVARLLDATTTTGGR